MTTTNPDDPERTKAERKLERSEEHYEGLARNIPGMTYRGTRSWTVEFISGSRSLCGYPAEEFLQGAREWMDVVHPDDRDRVREEAKALLTEPGQLVQEYRIVTREGETRWVEDHKTPRFTSDGEYRGVDGVVFDVTSRLRLEREILHAGSRERQSISQTLHDSLGQKLTGIALLAKSLELDLESQSLPMASDAGRLTGLISSAIAETRRITVGLAPVDLEPGSISVALKRLAEWTSDLCAIPCLFVSSGDSPVYDDDVVLHLYHVAQEAVNNAVRHAGASKIAIELAVEADEGKLIVKDNGKGLPGGEEKGTGMGLHTMRYRARILGGALDISCCADGGTVVTCSFENRKPEPSGTEDVGS